MPGKSVFVLRPAGLDDVDALDELLSASYGKLLKGWYTEDLLAKALPLMTRSNARLLASGTYYVAVHRDGRLIGCGGWTFERPGTGEIAPGVAHIRHVASHPDATGMGVGRALIARCLAEAHERGAATLECYSTLAAEGFYRSQGFETVGPISVPFPGDIQFPSILMKRRCP